MGSRSLAVLLLTLVAVALPARGARADQYANDSFTPGGTPSFQAGFVTGEMAAARFVPSSPGMLTAVECMFGGATGERTITLHVWADDGTSAPGTELYTGDFAISPSDTALQSLAVSVSVAGPFRVGVETHDGGLPFLALDLDGLVAGQNFVFATGTWMTSASVGITGDWILRADVTPAIDAAISLDAGAEDAATVSEDAASSTDAATSGDAASPGDAATSRCTSNAQCPLGQYCGSAGTCSFDCRTDSDCASGTTCNTLGRCVATAPAASGCACRASGRSAFPAALGLALTLAVFARAARRGTSARRRAL